jgi:hypothetical protein
MMVIRMAITSSLNASNVLLPMSDDAIREVTMLSHFADYLAVDAAAEAARLVDTTAP